MRTVSNTQVNMWRRCPKSWEFRYIKGLKIPPGGYMIQGRVYHEANAEYSKSIQRGSKLSVSDLSDIYLDIWERSTRKDKEFSHNEITWETVEENLKNEGFEGLNLYITKIHPFIPLEVECQKSRVIDDSSKVFGIIDRVDAGKVLVDHKVTRKAKYQNEVDADTQPTTYLYLIDTETPEEYNFEIHNVILSKDPRLQVIRTKRTMRQIEIWKEMVKEVSKAMQLGIAPPNPGNWWCGPKFCGYWDLCQK